MPASEFKNDADKQKFTTHVLEILEKAGGETGTCTVSHMLREMRDPHLGRRWTGIGSQGDFEDLLRSLGFTVFGVKSKNGRRETNYVKL